MTLSLIDVAKLFSSDGQRHMPDEFRRLAAACEREPADRTPFAAAADWLDDHEEPDYAAGWRWLQKNPGVEVRNEGAPEEYPRWRIKGLPAAVAAVNVEEWWVSHTLAAAVAVLSQQLAELRKLVA